MRAVNYIAQGIELEYPHVVIDMLAYAYSTDATKTRPRDNVVVQVALNTDGAVPLTDPMNINFTKQIASWNAVSNRVWLWGYQANFCNFLMPNPRWKNLNPNLQWMHAHGVRGTFAEGPFGIQPDETVGAMVGTGLDRLSAYIIGRTLWDVTLDGTELIDEFVNGYYGPVGGPGIALYIDLLQGSTKPGWAGCFVGCFDVKAGFLPPATVLEAGRILENTMGALDVAAVTGGVDGRQAAIYLQRVEAASIAIHEVVLLRWEELGNAAALLSVQWPFGEKMQLLGRFERVWLQNKMIKTNGNEGAGRQQICSIDCLKRVILNQTEPVPNRTGSDVSPCLQLEGSTWVHSKRCACETLDLASLVSRTRALSLCLSLSSSLSLCVSVCLSVPPLPLPSLSSPLSTRGCVQLWLLLAAAAAVQYSMCVYTKAYGPGWNSGCAM